MKSDPVQYVCEQSTMQIIIANLTHTFLDRIFSILFIFFARFVIVERISSANVVGCCNWHSDALSCLRIGVSSFRQWQQCSFVFILFCPLQRNGTLTEVSTINTGHNGMDKFGYLDQLNGMAKLPFWDTGPCTNITASEGSFFPPREYTSSDMRYVYDKDLCRIIPLEYKRTVYKDGIPADLYEMPENTFGDSTNNPDNSCYDTEDYKAVKGLQNISPCQFSEYSIQNENNR